jgi:Response regulators consisting of a CheY-like receiver domain and a winged-helix DNA-binding domain
MNEKILVVEDEDSIRGFLKINLQRNNFEVIEASNGEDGLRIALTEKPRVVILDVMLPGIDGFKVLEEIRKKDASIGIIMLTARSQDMDKIMGLEYGADDYIIKPFNPMELILRIRALTRRIGTNESDVNKEIIQNPPFTINMISQKAFKGERELELTPKEFILLRIFISNPGKAFGRDELLNLAWGYDFFGDPKIVDVNIRRLRSKIEEDSSNPAFIETVWGKGYRWRK